MLLSIEADIDECFKDGSVLNILGVFFIEDSTKIKLTCFIDKYVYTCTYTTMDTQADFVDHFENKTFEIFTNLCSQIL